MKLVILDYEVGNIKSIQFAFDRLGVTAVLSSDAEEIKAADKIIFPGVGEASSAMKKTQRSRFRRCYYKTKPACIRNLFRDAINVS
jgi:glutamine amidotransferase